MAKKNMFVFREVKHKKRKGVHAKSKSSKNKNSRNYVKPYNAQGR
tara:strand:+ start:2799 stop:2933 length:135 start_codon:yes stop_codon:yes gene_type:complete